MFLSVFIMKMKINLSFLTISKCKFYYFIAKQDQVFFIVFFNTFFNEGIL